jgi:hypothetical protein
LGVERRLSEATANLQRSYPVRMVGAARPYMGVLDAWRQIDPALTIGELAQAALAADLSQAGPIQSQLKTLETQLTDLRNRRDALYTDMWAKLKRVRSGVKAIYGDDSSQYEMIGGTRLSDRRSSAHRNGA